MKLTFLPFLLLTLLSINVAIADNQKDDPTLKNIPKAAVSSPAPSPSSSPSHHRAPEADFNIHEACNNSTIKDVCETTLKSLGGDKEHVKASQFAEDVVRYAQKEFGATAIKVREQMREDTLDKKVKIALSNCVKLYLDMADLLRGTYLGVRSKKFGPETTQFITMAHSFPRICEEGLHKAGTSGDKLGLYKSFKDLEDVATAMDAVIRYAAAHHKAAKH